MVSSNPNVIPIESDEDIHDEVEYCLSVVVWYVLGGNPPLNVMKG